MPMNHQEFCEIFRKFAYKKVATDTKNGITVPSPDDATFAAIEKEIGEYGMSVRVEKDRPWPETAPSETVVVYLTQTVDGTSIVRAMQLGK